MKFFYRYSLASVATCFSCFTSAQAGDDTIIPSPSSEIDSKSVIETVQALPVSSTRQIQPLISRYAQTTEKWTLRGGYRYFTDVPLQEVDSFDGSLADFELTVPLSDRWQMRLYLPFYTNGDARRMDSGNDVEIDGAGGLLDFPSVTFDYQFRNAQSSGEWNMAVYFGAGTVLQYLEETDQVTGKVDRINHRGSMAQFGFKADVQWKDRWALIGNLGGRYYWESDDIHPNDGSDVFLLMEVSATVVYNPYNAWAYPMLELAYQGSFSDYNSLVVVPQVVVPMGEHADVNLGVALGLLDDSPSTDARVQVTLRF